MPARFLAHIQTIPSKMIRIAFAFLALSTIAACGGNASSSNTPAQAEYAAQNTDGQLPADFSEFYQKFHTDSLYQVAHIAWPLQGLTSVEADSGLQKKQAIYWELATWRMHRPVDFGTGEFKRALQVLGDELVVEKISYAAANFGLERRFVRDSEGKWELIYYSDMLEQDR